MKQILLLCFSYYPNNTPGSQRMHSYAKCLLEQGYEPTILTLEWTRERCARWWGSGYYDPNMVDVDVCRVVRVPYEWHHVLNATVRYNLLEWLIPWWPLPLYWRVWAAAKRLVREKHFDLVLASGPPQLTYSLGRRLARRCRIPWIVEPRDLLGQLPVDYRVDWRHPWRFRHLLADSLVQRWEANLCQQASAVITVSPGLAEILTARGGRDVKIVYNGYDPEDFAPVSRVRQERFRIVYAGAISPGRDPEIFFQGLDILLSRHPEVAELMEAVFYASPHDMLAAAAQQHACRPLVRLYDRISRKELYAILKNAALLLHFSHAGTRGIMTSKITEYMGSGTPILTVPGDNDIVEQVLRETNAGVACADPTVIADVILTHYHEWEATGFTRSSADMAKVERYTRRNQAVEFVKIVARTLGEKDARTEGPRAT